MFFFYFIRNFSSLLAAASAGRRNFSLLLALPRECAFWDTVNSVKSAIANSTNVSNLVRGASQKLRKRLSVMCNKRRMHEPRNTN